MYSIRRTGYVDADDYDFCTLKSVRLWIFASFAILIASIALGAASLGVPTFVIVEPSVTNSQVKNLNRPRSIGYTAVCFLDTNECENQPNNSHGNEFASLMINLRLARLGLHAIGLSIMIICFFIAIIFLIFWFKVGADTACLRLWRLLLGIFLMLSGFCLQCSIIMFHVEQMQDKYGVNKQVPYGFGEWTKEQRTTTTIYYGSAYIMLWLATILNFISSWIFLGSTCCWNLDYWAVEEPEDKVSLPRISTLSLTSTQQGKNDW